MWVNKICLFVLMRQQQPHEVCVSKYYFYKKKVK